MTIDLKQLIAGYTQQVDAQLEKSLPAEVGPAKHLYAAMRYSVFNGGKRLRRHSVLPPPRPWAILMAIQPR